MSLREYIRKRDFRQTAEPPARKGRAKSKALRFVIQKHAASHLHYDFRLEMGGTLKSWAVPKGIPFVKGEKRLAMEVEDHPLAYAGFEGIIPKGLYGGGTVMVWDAGTWENLGGKPLKDLEEGKLHFALKGTKLVGEWTLIRMKRGDGNEWLLLKSGEDVKPVSKKRDDESSVSGRTMAQIARGEGRGVAIETRGGKSRQDRQARSGQAGEAVGEKGPSQAAFCRADESDARRTPAGAGNVAL